MGIKKTLGGDRLGSDNRIKQELHNFYRSNHNLSVTRTTSMAPGVLYPLYTQVALKGDTFDIDLSAFVRTLPTEGPLFGAFKLQVDLFQVPFRLYQAILHNNTTEIGMNMNQVVLPKISLETSAQDTSKMGAFHPSSLMKYLGMSGIGRCQSGINTVIRRVNAIPVLAYYDIFKNYYANKQEENAYVIMSTKSTSTSEFSSTISEIKVGDIAGEGTTQSWQGGKVIGVGPSQVITITGNNLITNNLIVNLEIKKIGTSVNIANENRLLLRLSGSTKTKIFLENVSGDGLELTFAGTTNQNTIINDAELRLQPFPLTNIDQMRKDCLTMWELGDEMVIGVDNAYLPYQALTGREAQGGISLSKNCFPMQGLVVKCYQSDMFNNWLDTTWVNQITSMSRISTTSGSFSIDALNFAKKVYDHYNRIAISGGTYDDWQEATYGDKVWGKSEKPIYCGGMSSEVLFDEVVSTTATGDPNSPEYQPLGTLGGRGSLNGRKGGHVIIKVNEASLIMAMVSLTPRVTYSQGNAWYMTDLDNMDDLHKPIFDRIGFQDLIVENMAWWDTVINPTNNNITRSSAGKQPAWIHYMTDVNKCYGDFALEGGKSFMTLNRLYDQADNGGVKDITTYIDPTKYNYAFAVDDLTAQNFWTFLKMDIKARRKMSATQIPNL